jgi:predicted nucleotidyltransferase
VNARPLLDRVAGVLATHHLEGILIGNAAAALQGAPVTTLDLDFFFRDTPLNRRKLKAVARELGAAILRPYYPVSKLFRVVRDDDGMQLDFLPMAHGIRSFESLRSRASRIELGGASLLVADLRDIIRSKRAAGRPRDVAVLPILEATLDEKRKQRDPAKR